MLFNGIWLSSQCSVVFELVVFESGLMWLSITLCKGGCPFTKVREVMFFWEVLVDDVQGGMICCCGCSKRGEWLWLSMEVRAAVISDTG